MLGGTRFKKKLKCKTVSGKTKLILHELFPDLLYEIAPVIIKMRALWLVGDCVISRYNHLAWGDYNIGT